MAIAQACKLDRVLDGLATGDRAWQGLGRAAPGLDGLADGHGREIGIEADDHPGGHLRAQNRQKRLHRVRAHAVGQGAAQGVVQLSGIDEPADLPRFRGDQEGLRHWVEGDVIAANIQQPGDIVDLGFDEQVQPRGRQLLGQRRAFVSRGPAREFRWERGDNAQRRGRLIIPDLIHGIGGGGNHLCTAQIAGDVKAVVPRGRQMHRVIADAPSALGILRQPALGRGVQQVIMTEIRARTLIAKLHAVAPIDEDGDLAGGDNRHAGRAGKAGDMGQAFVMRCDIFPLMGIEARQDERIQPARGQCLTQFFNDPGSGGQGSFSHFC